MPAPEFAWLPADPSDPDDFQTCESVPGYLCVIEQMDRRAWYCAVYRVPLAPDEVFTSTDADVLPLTAKAARRLCEMAVVADLYKRGADA